MKAVAYHRFGSPDVLELEEVEKPFLADDSLLIRVRSSSVNPAEWYAVRGQPWVARMAFGLRGPKVTAVGTDFAGVVEAVGAKVKRFKPGDEVFGGKAGAYAEYITVAEDKAVVRKPANLSFEQAGSVPIAAVTALQALRDKGRLQPGQRVLINGASGGVGHFAVQIAKALGARVTAVSSTKNLELLRSLGADEVIDYTRQDLTATEPPYDLALHVAGSRRWSDYRRLLTPAGTLVMVGATHGGRLLGPLSQLLKFRLASFGAGQKVVFFVAGITRDNLTTLSELLASGKVTPVIDRTYELKDVAKALTYLGEGHVRGKVVITV
jgi:NADPH:quinone reductase-like Zn-dependent oxidoreductase